VTRRSFVITSLTARSRRRLEAQIAVRQDPDQALAVDDGQARDAGSPHDRERFGDRLLRMHRERVGDHAALELFHGGHLGGLGFDRQVLVDEAEPAPCAIAIAVRASVTVSIAALTRGP
jgi:hypothetical protein